MNFKGKKDQNMRTDPKGGYPGSEYLEAGLCSFVFAPGKRRITGPKAQELRELLLPEIPAVGVFVNHPIDDILSLTGNGIIDLIQLHGDEDRDYMMELKSYLAPGFPVMKAIRVRQSVDMKKAENLPADFLLFDTYTKGLYGGSGKTFDWSMIPDIKKALVPGRRHRLLKRQAGHENKGLLLDLSSSVETEGKKRPAKNKRDHTNSKE